MGAYGYICPSYFWPKDSRHDQSRRYLTAELEMVLEDQPQSGLSPSLETARLGAPGIHVPTSWAVISWLGVFLLAGEDVGETGRPNQSAVVLNVAHICVKTRQFRWTCVALRTPQRRKGNHQSLRLRRMPPRIESHSCRCVFPQATVTALHSSHSPRRMVVMVQWCLYQFAEYLSAKWSPSPTRKPTD